MAVLQMSYCSGSQHSQRSQFRKPPETKSCRKKEENKATHRVPISRVARSVADNVEPLQREGVVVRFGDQGRDNVVVGDDALAGFAAKERVVQVGRGRVQGPRRAARGGGFESGLDRTRKPQTHTRKRTRGCETT